MRYVALALCLSGFALQAVHAQAGQQPVFTRADTLRGSNTPQRAWWDVTYYDLNVAISPSDSSIRGSNGITYRVLSAANEMQIDLVPSLQIDSIVQDGRTLTYRREGLATFVTLLAPQKVGARKKIVVYYHGRPTLATNAPWAGGFVWKTDSLGHRWIATAVQGLGASAWWPNKDIPSEEPDSQRIVITVPDSLTNISNGRLRKTTRNANGTTTTEWFVSNPINNYDVAVNAGHYAHFSDTYDGEGGRLTLDFWPLAYNLEKAKVQFQEVKPMLRCFESWFGPYPWYKDGFKLIETPYLGMEHQSAVAYGNRYKKGYMGRDLSGTGHGLTWDFIIIHESAHEWFGNNITVKDVADMWVQEGFTTYAEGLYVECISNKEAGAAYLLGMRKNVGNKKPMVGPYGVHREGDDVYNKGAGLVHMIRHLVDDDVKWRKILRGMSKTFWHQTVTGQQIQDYLIAQAGLDLKPVFQQYLTTTNIPVLEYRLKDSTSTLEYRWAHVVDGFTMPVKVTVTDGEYKVIWPSTSWQSTPVRLSSASAFKADPNFYIVVRPVP